VWLHQLLITRSALTPGATAVSDDRSALTWREFADRVDRRAAYLEATTERLDRVAYLASGRKDHFELLFACARTGRTFVPLNPHLTGYELEHQTNLVGPRVLVTESDFAEAAAAAVGDDGTVVVDVDDAVSDRTPPPYVPLAAHEPAVIFFTSATTGVSKGVEVPERSLMANALSWALDVAPHYGPARFLSACPLFHGSSVIALDYLAAGYPVHVLPRFTPRGFLAAVAERDITQTFLVPTMVDLLLRLPVRDLEGLRTLEVIGHGAAPMPPELARRCRAELGVALHNVYGITEGGGPVIVAPTPADRPVPVAGATPIGLPMTGVEAKIVGESGSPVGPGEPGELYLRSAGSMTGYWHDPESSAAAFEGDWLRTRDIAVTDESGMYWILDRRTDLILRGGQNVYPAEVEQVLRQLDDVVEAAVVGVPSPTWGQTPVAFVHLTPGSAATPASITRWCSGRLASYKLPTQIRIVDRIPVSPSGKVLRRELRSVLEN
jgi:acyl-CoA synthetase (AMP-forming)/AMP-acid ligase II